MVSVEINGSKRLLVISAAGHVSKEEVKQAAEQVHNALRTCSAVCFTSSFETCPAALMTRSRLDPFISTGTMTEYVVNEQP